MTTLPRYVTLRAALPAADVSLGCGGLHLFDDLEIEGGQVGYSVAPDGKSLCGEGHGAWSPNWIVIGYETACGDPLFVETCDPVLPVFTAIHGEGAWEPMPISISLDAFFASLKEFDRLAAGRGSPAELDAHPISDDEQDAFRARISLLNNGRIEMEFWDVLLTG